jgi:Probable Zinc-ribbon domain
MLGAVASLADFPHLVAQLDPKKNGPLAPRSITAGTHRKLWWRCPEGPDHLWEAAVRDRVGRGTGCPFCVGHAVSVTNSLARRLPEIARQWHPTKNGELRASDVVLQSQIDVWWKCPGGPDHEWRSKVQTRFLSPGCPFCTGHRPSKARNLAVVYPELVEEWHPTKNGALTPEGVTPRSSRGMWWMCCWGHAWRATPANRAKGQGCPFCAGQRTAPELSLAVVRPALAKEWHPTKNGDLGPADVTMGSSKTVWWKCPKGADHEWDTQVSERGAAGAGCPFCAGQRVSATNSLAARFPAVAALWHPTKNGDLTPRDVTPRSGLTVWWHCPSGHAWEAPCANMARDGLGTKEGAPSMGCPFCRNLRVSPTNSLAARFPKVAGEWHPTKNGDLTPRDVIAGSKRRAWWRCAFGHEWQTSLCNRTGAGTGCLACYRLGHKRSVATKRARRSRVRLAAYDGPTHGPVRRVK